MVMMMASLIQRTGLAAGSNMVNDLAAANGPHQHVFLSAVSLRDNTVAQKASTMLSSYSSLQYEYFYIIISILCCV
jgi:hypothetical protein